MAFRINLVKNEVMSPGKRRAVFFSMILYVVMVGLLLVVLSYKAAVNYIKISGYKRCGIEGAGKVSADAKDIKSKMLFYAEKLEKIDRILSDDRDIARILTGLSGPFSGLSRIDNFIFNAPAKTLEFDVVTPEAGMKESLDANALISAWKRDAYLMSCIKDIESASVSKRKIGSDSFFVSRFSCSLSG